MRKKPWVNQYLERYADPLARESFEEEKDKLPSKPYQHVLVVPARREPLRPLRAIAEFCQSHGAALVVVFNEDRDANIEHAKSSQRELRKFDHVYALDVFSSQRRMTSAQGVGRARKIGCDFALMMIHSGSIDSQWIHSSDADATLPTAYFKAISNLDASKRNSGTCVYDFIHSRGTSPEEELAMAHYEFALQSYRAGLQSVGSRFAYVAIGSCMAMHANTYAQVRGFKKDKKAGEDFYYLNKACRTAPVHELESTLELSSRLSKRTPYGTGQALEAIVTRNTQLNDPRMTQRRNETNKAHSQGFTQLYHPEIFQKAFNHVLAKGDSSLDALATLRCIKSEAAKYQPLDLQEAVEVWAASAHVLNDARLARAIKRVEQALAAKR